MIYSSHSITGAGKSFNAPYILEARGITAKEVVMSSLLNSPEAERLKCEGGLVGDALVIEVLLETLLKPGRILNFFQILNHF